MSAIFFRLACSALCIEALLLTIRVLPDLNSRIVEAILLLVATSLVYLVSVFWILRNTLQTRAILTLILVSAGVFRITLWPIFPAFSDDIYRYRWEGKLQSLPANPYQVRPADAVRDTRARDGTFPNVPLKDFKAGYGPLIELEERIVYRTVSRFTANPFVQVFWFKLPAAVFELGLLAALVALLRARGIALQRILIYAWCPTPIFEFWVNGHNDAIPVFFLVLALLAAAHRSWIFSFTWLSLAVAAKLWPLALFPAFIWNRNSGRPVRFYQWTLVVPIFALAFLPYWSNVVENAQFMTGFVGGWRNNDSLFGFLLALTGDLYSAKYTAFAIIAVFVAWTAMRPWRLETACLVTIAGLLLISATCQPWYLTWFIPLLTFTPSAPLLLWVSTMPLAYSVLIQWKTHGEWNGSTAVRWLIYAPFYALLLGKYFFDRHRQGVKK